MPKSPFAWVRESAQPALLLILTVLVAGLAVRLAFLDRELKTSEAPLGIVSYELAGSAERARVIFCQRRSLGEVIREAARQKYQALWPLETRGEVEAWTAEMDKLERDHLEWREGAKAER